MPLPPTGQLHTQWRHYYCPNILSPENLPRSPEGPPYDTSSRRGTAPHWCSPWCPGPSHHQPPQAARGSSGASRRPGSARPGRDPAPGSLRVVARGGAISRISAGGPTRPCRLHPHHRHALPGREQEREALHGQGMHMAHTLRFAWEYPSRLLD
jgi:hypothetical protein